MEIVNLENIRLVPGESFHALFSVQVEEPNRVGLFIRPVSNEVQLSGDSGMIVRAGLIKFDDVLLVLTMVKLESFNDEIFDIWWNYHTDTGPEEFRRMAEQDKLSVHYYTDKRNKFVVEIDNPFCKFFNYASIILEQTKPWTEIEFDRALRGFCAQSYPRDNLWDTIQFKANFQEPLEIALGSIESYPGIIPDELRSHYSYVPDRGHCIRIIPSMLEPAANQGNPDEYLHAAPVKTVLRCGIRWVRGHPVAPIPFIPGHGLAVPPDDVEF
jgi:hypothetical protein